MTYGTSLPFRERQSQQVLKRNIQNNIETGLA